MGGWRKILRKGGSAVGSGVILIGAASGAIGATRDTLADGNFAALPNRLSYYYTGFDPGSGTWNQQQFINSVGVISFSILAGKIIKWAARQI